MKKITVLGCVLLFTMSCKAQTIVPVEKSIDYIVAQNGIPKDTYLKDVNNLFSRYLGTWKGTFENNNYTFIITKVKDAFLGVSEDKLRVRYLITSLNGSILEDTRNLSDTSPYVIEGSYFSKGAASYVLNYLGKNSQCGQKGTVFIRMKNATYTEMSLTFEPAKVFLTEDTCLGLKLAKQILPKEGMRLTKQ